MIVLARPYRGTHVRARGHRACARTARSCVCNEMRGAAEHHYGDGPGGHGGLPLAQAAAQPALPVVYIGLGRIVALYYRSSASYRNR